MRAVIDRPTIGLALALAALCGSAPRASTDDGATAPPGDRSETIRCEGSYPKPLQGVCTDGRGALYWSFAVELVKTGLDGKRLRAIPVADHHGDLCHHDGKIYVAVNLGEFDRPPGRADSWIYVYDAETLDELGRLDVPELVDGAGGVAYRAGGPFRAGRFVVVGGLPEGVEENSVYEYDDSFRFLRRHALPSGPARLGIQTAEFAEGHWWFGCDGSPPQLLKADPAFRLVGRQQFDAALGIVGLGGGRFLVASGARDEQGRYTGSLHPAELDETGGLRRVDAPNP